jgi:hypothetical protein
MRSGVFKMNTKIVVKTDSEKGAQVFIDGELRGQFADAAIAAGHVGMLMVERDKLIKALSEINEVLLDDDGYAQVHEVQAILEKALSP